MDYRADRMKLTTSTPLNSVKRNISFSLSSDNNPVTKPQSRKRKSVTNYGNMMSNSFIIYQETSENTTIDSYLQNSNNSTLSNDISYVAFRNGSPPTKSSEDAKLTISFEKCNIGSFHDFTDFENASKKCKWDNEELDCRRKSSSAPNTPQHPEIESDVYMKKYRSLEFTPTKATYIKIGTPEKNEILYSQLKEVKPLAKPKSPQKLRNELKRLSKPARKRLFMCRDFIYLFTKMENHRNVIHKIFAYLNDTDLVNVSKVSTLWRSALENDSIAYKRYKNYMRVYNISKENIPNIVRMKLDLSKNSNISNITNTDLSLSTSEPNSATDNWKKFAKMATSLSKSQRLTKCQICTNPAVTEKYFAQCTNKNCAYIWCNRCLSGSKTGPADFICKCLETNSPPASPPRSKLANISNIDNFNFLNTESSYTVSSNTSSGYFSLVDSEKSLSFLQNNSLVNIKKKPRVLTDLNKNINNTRKTCTEKEEAVSFHSVAEQCMKQKLHKKRTSEPNSPPKVNVPVAGSERSKKNLRRLCR